MQRDNFFAFDVDGDEWNLTCRQGEAGVFLFSHGGEDETSTRIISRADAMALVKFLTDEIKGGQKNGPGD